ncbi:MAG: hypothetical protein ACN6O7_09075 [Sphingobacterium sp.]
MNKSVKPNKGNNSDNGKLTYVEKGQLKPSRNPPPPPPKKQK